MVLILFDSVLNTANVLEFHVVVLFFSDCINMTPNLNNKNLFLFFSFPESRGQLWPELQWPRPHASPRLPQRQPPWDAMCRRDRSCSQQQLLCCRRCLWQQGGRYKQESLVWTWMSMCKKTLGQKLRVNACVLSLPCCFLLRYQSPGRPADRQPGGCSLQQALPSQWHLQLQVTNMVTNWSHYVSPLGKYILLLMSPFSL